MIQRSTRRSLLGLVVPLVISPSGRTAQPYPRPDGPAAYGVRPRISADFSRISTLRTLPVTVIGNSSVMCT